MVEKVLMKANITFTERSDFLVNTGQKSNQLLVPKNEALRLKSKMHDFQKQTKAETMTTFYLLLFPNFNKQVTWFIQIMTFLKGPDI